jgi:acetyl/propionyl-CoA carboxylase alpha subunit
VTAVRLRRILVANRGEIARRVIRGAHDMGLEAVAVYTSEDRAAPYVGEADLALHLPGRTLAESYLNPRALVDLARRAEADALHPGYGFLSENPVLPEACAAAGIIWVGPTPESMRVMGHKVRAKDTVSAAGVPVLPGVAVRGDTGPPELERLAAGVGYPLLVKASAGGGGRGMRLVPRADVLLEAVASAQREAHAAFGSDEVFLERYLTSPRHVEVQIIGDTKGSVVHLFDRECSVQRRHQKLIEEAPAVLVGAATRERMWHAAVAAARSVDYQGVGTVEFLVDGDDFFFLEMNTRLQVEHGVTELVTGLDLVGLQLAVAAGAPLPFAQGDIAVSGHAVEARLCAERPRDDYRPTPGTATHVRWPQGAGVRTDAAIDSGTTVSPSFDSLVAKVMVHGAERQTAIGRLSRALRALEVDGLETNRALLGAILADPVFVDGDAGIDYLDQRDDLRQASLGDEARHRHAAAAAFALLHRRASQSLVALPAAGWRNVGTAHHVDVFIDGQGALRLRSGGSDDPVAVLIGGEWEEVGSARTAAGATDHTVDLVAQGGAVRRYRVRTTAQRAEVNGPEGQSSFVLRTEDDADERGGTAGECRAPLPGAVTKVLVALGDAVPEGAGLVVLEAMKMEHTLRSGGEGVVGQILCAPGDQVDVGDILVVVEPA